MALRLCCSSVALRLCGSDARKPGSDFDNLLIWGIWLCGLSPSTIPQFGDLAVRLFGSTPAQAVPIAPPRPDGSRLRCRSEPVDTRVVGWWSGRTVSIYASALSLTEQTTDSAVGNPGKRERVPVGRSKSVSKNVPSRRAYLYQVRFGQARHFASSAESIGSEVRATEPQNERTTRASAEPQSLRGQSLRTAVVRGQNYRASDIRGQ